MRLDLVDVVRKFPGGIERAAEAAGISRTDAYAIATGERSMHRPKTGRRPPLLKLFEAFDEAGLLGTVGVPESFDGWLNLWMTARKAWMARQLDRDLESVQRWKALVQEGEV